MKLLNNTLIVSLTLIIACNGNTQSKRNSRENYLEKHLGYFSKEYPLFEKEGWSLVYGDELEEMHEFQISRTIGDTVMEANLILFKDSVGSMTPFIKDVSISFPSNSNRIVLSIKNDWDTVYLFQVPREFEFGFDKPDINKINFYRGKYYYLAENGYLDDCQLEYYIVHKDSLNAIKGNNLKDLPVCNAIR
ncbi:MAG: hypothetical protein KF845_07560 [Cyclobacteriaceae bacterium]|nr:hypothetical protein [Cyclobacteriaceae bacterium]